MLALAALGLTFGACKKDEKAAGDEAAKPAEGDTAAEGETAPEEPAKEEEAAEGEAAEGEAAAEGEGDADGEMVTTGVKECDDLIATYSKCEKLPQESRDAFMTGAKAWKQAVDTGGDDAKTALATSCGQAAEASKAALSAVGCE